MDGRQRWPRTSLSAWWLLVPAAILLFGVDPAATTIWPMCPFRHITGWLCPLCGSLRATHLALHGHVAASCRANPLIWGIALSWAAGAVWRVMVEGRSFAMGSRPGRWTPGPDWPIFVTRRSAAPNARHAWSSNRWPRLAFLAIVVAFTIGRNVSSQWVAWLKP